MTTHKNIKYPPYSLYYMSATELLDVVDEDNNVIGTATKKEVLDKNLIHRGVVIFVFNSKGELFVHKRTADKIIYPSMFDMTCGGAVKSGEEFDDAAARETTEEAGIENPELQFLFDDRYKSEYDNVIAKVYKVVYDAEIKIQKDEIVEGYFLPIPKLKELMEKEKFCPDALQYFKKMESMDLL